MSVVATEGVIDVLRARLQRAPLASASVPIPADLDLAAAVLAARRSDDRFFCFEQPDRDGYAVCGLGAAATVRDRGPGRVRHAGRPSRALALRTVGGDPAGDRRRPPGAGPVLLGGFAFAPDGGEAPEWSSLAPAQLVLPEVSLSRQGGEARLTVNVAVVADAAP